MHIVILADAVDNQRAGIHVYTKKIIENLLKIDQENRYTFIHEKENPLFDELQETYPEKVTHHIVPKKQSPLAGTFRKFFHIPKLIKTLKPEIVLETCHIGPFRTPKNTKRAVIIHDLTPILFPKFHIKRSTIIHKLLLKRVIKNADIIITPSENTKKDILKYQSTKAKIIAVPPGIEHEEEIEEEKPILEFFKTGDPTKLRMSPTQKPPTDPPIQSTPYLLYLGTIEPRKNLETLIEAFAELNSRGEIRGLNLVLAGDVGWKAENILKKIAEANAKLDAQIILTGYLTEEEKKNYYKHAEIFIYPSLYEGFGIPPLEAMAQETAVICSTGGSLKEVFSDNALTFEPKDKQKLKQHIKTLIQNPRLKKEMTRKALEYSKTFNWEKSASEILKVLL